MVYELAHVGGENGEAQHSERSVSIKAIDTQTRHE